ncbi:hypothetical protein C1645_882354 [Glomus cerebriforme]|uniref:F-box domain-containing protein n=1 Tax=Glomus cerebriforme TaxID=658196 RepID=A0A397S296_9GLOM|nr:hypothetical protein C1645_882354 [Glomus cerebriforme]
MPKLNGDILYLIFQELQDDEKTLYSSCLSVNKIWCEIIIPILWKDPWKFLKEGKEKLLLNVIISHLSDESKNNYSSQNINPFNLFNLFTKSYQKPLFNYISFCRHLNLHKIERIIDISFYKKSEIPIIKNEIINLFINENTKFTHLYIPNKFEIQIHLISGAQYCFSELEFLSCNTGMNDGILSGLAEICKSIKELRLFIKILHNNYDIIKLIKAQKKLLKISFLNEIAYAEVSFCEILENSLINHVKNIQYIRTTMPLNTKFLSSFINLTRLELSNNFGRYVMTWNCLKKLSLPFLEILIAKGISIESLAILANLIENTSGHLIEIRCDIDDHSENDNERITRAIYQNCPNLKILKLSFGYKHTEQLKNLLINCLNLELLHIANATMYWDQLLKILANSSPPNLFKFKFSKSPISSESLKRFFDLWKGKNLMILQIFSRSKDIENVMKEYKAKGIVKRYIRDYQYYSDDDDYY